MTVAIDNTGQSTSGLAVSTLTIGSFVVGAGVDRCIYLGVSQYSNPDRVPSAVFNTSEAFTVHDSATIAEGAGTRRVTILKLVNPSNVTANIVVSWAGAVDEVVAGADSWTGVDQTTPFGTAVKSTSSGASTSSVVVPSTADGAVQDTISVDGDATVVVSPNQTQRWRVLAAFHTTEGAGQSAAGTGGNVTCTWSNIFPTAPGTAAVAHIGVPINASVAAATSAPPGLVDPIYSRPMGVNQMTGPWGMVAEALRAMGSTIIPAPVVPGFGFPIPLFQTRAN